MTDKEKVARRVSDQPDDASYDEIIRELTFERMVERGLKDVREGRTVSNEEMAHRIAQWQK